MENALASLLGLLALLQGTDSTGPFPPGAHTTHRLRGVCFSPWVAGEDPNHGAVISPATLAARMRWIAGDAEWVRTYGATHGLQHAGAIARALGFKTALGAWLGSDAASNAAEIASLVALANAGQVDLAIVGSEVLWRNELNQAQLIAHLQTVRNSVPPHVLVTTAELHSLYSPALVDAVDVVACHVHPYWEGVSIDDALAFLDCRIAELRSIANGKLVVVAETGWPDCGNPLGAALPSPSNASRYFLEVAGWSQATGTPTFFFEALTEPFKVAYEGAVGACWGYRDTQGRLKPGRRRVFQGHLSADAWPYAFPPGGVGAPELTLTTVPPLGSSQDLRGEVRHVLPLETRIAVYIYVGAWWTKPTAAQPLTVPSCDGSWVTDVTTGGVDESATRIAAFLLPRGFTPPVLLGQSALPPALFANALDHVEVVR